MKNVVFLCNEYNESSGWSIINYNYINYFARKNRCFVFTSKNSKNKKIKNNVITYKSLNNPNDSFLKSNFINIFLKILKIKRYKIDYIFILNEPYAFFISSLKFFLKCKVYFLIVGTYSTKYLKRNNIYKFLYLKSLNKIDNFISISEYSLKLFVSISKKKILKKNVQIIYPGISYLENKNYKIKRKKQFLSIGHIKERKGTFLLIKAFHEFLKKNDNSYTLLLIGNVSGKYAHQCIRYIHDNKLEKMIFIKSDLSQIEIQNYIKKSLVHFLVSTNIKDDYEGFGIVHIESNLSGTPSVGCYDCGNESAIKNGVNGYLINQNNIGQIYEKMVYFSKIYNTKKFTDLSISSHEYSKNFDWNKQLERINL